MAADDPFDLDAIPPWRGLPGPPPARPAAWRRHVAGGSVAVALVVGMQEALEGDRRREPVVIEVDVRRPVPASPVTLFFDPVDPAATVAYLRRRHAV
jgi:hypothetical protein